MAFAITSHGPARVRRAGLVLVSCAFFSCAELGIDPAVVGDVLGALPTSGESRTTAGLKEALRVASERGVAQASRPGGFLDDPRLRIGLPDELEAPAKALRAIGLRGAADDLEVTMNRAAERAASEATLVLWQAVSALTIQDATRIVRGPDDAATAFFRGQTEDTLRQRFGPIVEASMREVGLYQAYDALVARFRVLEFVASPTVELDRYVTDATLDGLFTVLAAEEKRIRTEPAARTSELLREVFGSG